MLDLCYTSVLLTVLTTVEANATLAKANWLK